ncbi:uncharacterized protein LOC132253517 [Vitis vinifera]|uniref:uncharacterized protein LOC132253517 n=1 Tax=Vitis vinifera TaxID=29760 RepID=UPI0028830B7A|nr:uncharacterized protein LOC132253517 [Vitis vinifera]
MTTVRRKRKEHLPATCSQVKLPKSWCSGKKFISVIARLPDDKRDAITEMGFGGLLHLACRELRYELCSWIISNYDTAYHQLNMATGVVVPVIAQDVGNIMGIPCNGEEIVVHTRRDTSNRTYTISLLEQNLENLAIGDDFRKTFLIFACATLLAPNSKLEGIRDLWDTIWDDDVGVQENWSKFVLHYIEDGIREYQKNQPTYIRGCFIFLQFHLNYNLF